MDNAVKFGIVTVVLNSESTIGQTIDSVKNQKYQSVTHLIIDGGSNDKTMAVIQGKNHDRLNLLVRPRLGIYESMNVGIESFLNEVDVVGFLNSDDYLFNKNILVDIAEKINGHNVLMSAVNIVKMNDTNHSIRIFNPTKNKFLLALSVFPPHPGFYVSTKILKAMPNPFFDPKAGSGADIGWMKKVIKKSQFVTTTNNIAVVMRDGGVSNSGLANKIDMHIQISRYLYGYFWTIVFPIIFLVKQIRYIKQRVRARKFNKMTSSS